MTQGVSAGRDTAYFDALAGTNGSSKSLVESERGPRPSVGEAGGVTLANGFAESEGGERPSVKEAGTTLSKVDQLSLVTHLTKLVRRPN